MDQFYDVKAMWDGEAEVWRATSEDIPGLVVEADTEARLVHELRILVPVLLAGHLVRPDRAVVRITSERHEIIAPA